MTTLYAILGVPEHASLEEIKRAYRRAAMKSHPDRNLGREAEAHAAFQEIRDAYAILSDPVQRQVYDEVYAREMERWQAEHEAEQEQERAAQREAERAAQQHYEAMVALAMRFAGDGHNRDVIFGVLLGRDCEAELAARIADSVWALQESRRAEAAAAEAQARAEDEAGAEGEAPAAAAGAEAQSRRHTTPFESFWHGLFGLHPQR
ncbi:molecular chaperone DnaJ [Cupriavidus sp. USMAHM13]|uniref:J domain-containing protein n=1 Tax=Cupriavidus sp. USMAHM13 TaxID=1389192 RepID=UPI0008A670B9|nr:J domain-containing protein [Cupriavidus sp. USMAHM13]AOZ01713.1 molecular chaperone DnaJ [Cupriavidus sp. USMAHM13]